MAGDNIIVVDDVSFAYTNVGELAYESMIISGVSFDVRRGEFVSLIGPSGCGKSTLLRIIAGLIRPRSGRVVYNGSVVNGPTRGISFVFQDFALLPWLTNIENVKLGLSFSSIDDNAKDEIANGLLEKLGLSGFEDAYPNSLSGGMKQRVGIARALASKPDVLLMDEPFSALDELTANLLRSDISAMLRGKDIQVSCVLMVTHNVDEAVELSDKIAVLSNRPSRLKGIIDVALPYPRNKRHKDFIDLTDRVYGLLTQ
ncbi:MAG: ABC transporter ATP-binding protein [Candidatus Marsarchaeota archaeon]|jgi:NitT/TauT family transport system ATP-binding protein|nr:ABC transporter ATP-binding protein [Candidatus Marsarchaeota archaeon]